MKDWKAERKVYIITFKEVANIDLKAAIHAYTEDEALITLEDAFDVLEIGGITVESEKEFKSWL